MVTTGADTVLLRLDDVTQRWGDRVVLDGVSLEIAAGSIVGVAGDNGAGKTTLMRTACGMLIPASGTVCFRGRDIERDRSAYQRSLGLLSAGDRGLYARLTVRQNLDFLGGLAALPRRRRRERIAAELAEFALEDLAERRVERLSMGQRQRVRMASIFLHDPLLVFLDEPRTSLDEPGVAMLARALDRLVGRGGAALWVSHEVDEPLVHDVSVLRAGRLWPRQTQTASAPHDSGSPGGEGDRLAGARVAL
jgi:ABC-2 type transport system ATP-binding protein